MSVIRSILFLLFVSLPVTSPAGVVPEDFPGDTVWYLHADVKQMRNTDSGRSLYEWLDDEVFDEIHEEIGIDIGNDIDSITAFSAAPNGTIILIEGRVDTDMRQSLLAIARQEADVTEIMHGKKQYYYFSEDGDDSDNHDRHNSSDPLEDLEDGAYLSFAVENMVLVTAGEEQMKELLDNNGKVAGSDNHSGALFVLTADKSFVQAGLQTDHYADDDDDWDSNIIRNTKQAAIMVSDSAGLVAIDAHLVSSDPKMASSIGSIASGLISMQAFNSELDPAIKEMLANTRVEVKGNVLSVTTIIDPKLIVSMLND